MLFMRGRAEMQKIIELFMAHEQDSKPLFRGAGGEVSWKNFVADVGRFAQCFTKIDSGTVILYIPNNFYLFCVCFFALVQANKAVALPAMLTPQNASMYADLTKVIVSDVTDNFPGFACVVPNAPNNLVDWEFRDMDQATIYFFTSGSTGVPKRIKKTLTMLVSEVEYHITHHSDKIAEFPVVIASIAPHHMYGVLWRVLFPIFSGLAVDTDIIFSPEELLQKQSDYDKVLFITTPSFLDGITRYGEQYKFAANCIGIVTSGSLLSAKTSESAYEIFGVSPFEVFGSTETGGIAFRQQKFDTNWTIFETVNVSIQNDCLLINSPYCFENPYLMSDAARMLDGRRFELIGRADRIVKIAEERISLPDIERQLESHPYIARAYCTAIRRGIRDAIGCMFEPTDAGAEKIIAIGRHAFVNEIKKYLSGFVPAVALPKYVRIVHQIPTNTQGKFVKNEILSMLNSSVVEPIMQHVKKTDSNLSADLTFLGDSAYFVGHFPKFPILPGVIQMHFVFVYLKHFFNTSSNAFEVVKLKYSSLILPDVTTHFELVRMGPDEFSFCYSQKGKVCSTGKIVIKGRQ